MSLVDQLRALITDLFAMFIPSEAITRLLASIFMITFWVILAFIVMRVVKMIIFKTKKLEERLDRKETKEQETLRKLVNNIIRFFFVFWILIMILNELGLDLVPLLAGAGVLAFAVGFGAQELIKDIISGIFLIVEKTFKIDDYVEIGSHAGTVIDVGIRRIKIQTWKGEVITINNGDIKTVKNFSINPSYAVIEFRAGYEFDIREFEKEDFKKMLKAFKETFTDVLEMPKTIPLIDINGGLQFTVNIKTKIRKHIAVEREFRRALINYFNDKNITIKTPIHIEKV